MIVAPAFATPAPPAPPRCVWRRRAAIPPLIVPLLVRLVIVPAFATPAPPAPPAAEVAAAVPPFPPLIAPLLVSDPDRPTRSTRPRRPRRPRKRPAAAVPPLIVPLLVGQAI